MTETQQKHLVGFLKAILGRSDFFLLGDRGKIQIVFPDIAFHIGGCGERPCAARNRYFALSFTHANITKEQERVLHVLRYATERFAQRFPWFPAAVKEGRVALKNNPELLHRLISSPNQYRQLFLDLEAIKKEVGRKNGHYQGLQDLFDFEAIQGLFFDLASALPPQGDGEMQDHLRSPQRDLADLKRHRLLFLNFLSGTLGPELEAWTSRIGARSAILLGKSNWRKIACHRSKRTVVFCFGVHSLGASGRCIRFLLDNLSSFAHVAFIDIGERPNADASPAAGPRAKALVARGGCSFFLESPNGYLGGPYYSLPRDHQIPYIPVVSRPIAAQEIPIDPKYDFFLPTNGQQGTDFLFRHTAFFSRCKFLVGTKGVFRLNFKPGEREIYFAAHRRIRESFPGAVFIPVVPRYLHFCLWRAARNIVIIYPEDWDNTSYTLSEALASGRALITSPHAAISRIDPSCYLHFRPEAEYDDRALADLFCNDQNSLLAARKARAFVSRRLEFSPLISRIIATTLRMVRST
jgi:hypothetical protein